MPPFDIRRIAIHFVDKADKKNRPPRGPRLSRREARIETYPDEERKAITDFLSRHLQGAWEAVEGQQTRAATFVEDSDVARWHARLEGDADGFFEVSCDLARRLWEVSPANASPGLLLVLWFLVPDAPRPFLGLFKLDPGPRDQVALERDEAGEILLRLAVERIELALPEPERVLKWALIPHPPALGQPSRFGLKLRDMQQREADPAAYFTDFLGCTSRLSERQAAQTLLNVLADYGSEQHPDQDWQARLEPLINELGRSKQVLTPSTVAQKVALATVFTGFDESTFQERLAASPAGDMSVSPQLFQRAQIRYELPAGIVIQGPATAMENFVTIVPVAGAYEIRITTPNLPLKKLQV